MGFSVEEKQNQGGAWQTAALNCTMDQLSKNQGDPEKLLVKESEAAVMIGESGRTVRRLMDKGAFRSVKRGRSRLYLVSDLHDYVARLFQKNQTVKVCYAS